MIDARDNARPLYKLDSKLDLLRHRSLFEPYRQVSYDHLELQLSVTTKRGSYDVRLRTRCCNINTDTGAVYNCNAGYSNAASSFDRRRPCPYPAAMVRTAQSTTFSASAYFDDRGPHGTAQPITEYVHVSPRPLSLSRAQPHRRSPAPRSTRTRKAPFASHSVLFFPQRRGRISLWGARLA